MREEGSVEFIGESMADVACQMKKRGTEGSMKSIVIKVIGAGGFFTFLTRPHRPSSLLPNESHLIGGYPDIVFPDPHGRSPSGKMGLPKSQIPPLRPSPCPSISPLMPRYNR